ncbi:MAG: outer membrane beta-barrel protein [Prolixibacteraceae bacterium]
MRFEIKISLVMILLFSWAGLNAQVNYSFVVGSGLSNNHGQNLAYQYDEDGYILNDHREIYDGNLYSYGAMFSIEGGITEHLRTSKFSFEQGIGFESKAYYSSADPKYFPELTSVKTKLVYNAITVPVKIKYDLNNTFTAFGGVKNVLKIGSSNSSGLDRNFNLRAMLGLNAALSDRYFLGFGYEYDITPYTKMPWFDIFYRFDVITFKVGVVF